MRAALSGKRGGLTALALRAGALATGVLAPSAGVAQQATADSACPPAQPAPAALGSFIDLTLTPGKTLSLSDLTPEALKEIAAFRQEATARQARDWPALCKYAEANAAVIAAGRRPDVVFLGDSITENWEKGDPALFGPGILDRGISGQTTPQILLRMYPDVVNLRPRLVHVMAGTNDISGNTGPESDRTIVDNIRAMIVLAKANRITFVLGSLTPSAGFAFRPGFDPSQRIRRVNGLLRQLAAEQQVRFVDYHTPLSTEEGGMRAGLANDGLHPNRAGYAVIHALAEDAIANAAGPRAKADR